ncbi:MAG: T9SS type A sorting domain-containing protein [Crocinitomicaceae bacterium]|nr:T9SS type A sorting domain-containing protein [Crocinitomicaceae bacterium]
MLADSQTPLFQNSNENIWAGQSVACTTTGPGTIHDNKFLRVFDTDNFPAIQDTAFFVYIEMAVQECNGGAYNLIGRVYKLNGVLQYSNMTLISDDTAATYPDSSLYRMKIPFTDGYALPGDTVVTEVFAPLNPAITFFPGANPYVESGPSYISAPGCAFPEPVTFTSLSYPGVKLILKLWVNQKPILNDISTFGFKDNPINFMKADFDASLTDYDADTITMIRIQTLPTNGVLSMNGNALSIGDSIFSHQIDSMSYLPNLGYARMDLYTVMVKDDYHWSNNSTDITIDVMNWQLGVHEYVLSTEKVYPNPTSNTLTIKMDETIEFIKVFDQQGKCVTSLIGNDKTVDVSKLENGLYFLKVKTLERTALIWFVKN